MRLLTTIFSAIILSAKRLWNQRLLIFCLLAGLVAAVGLLYLSDIVTEALNAYLPTILLSPQKRVLVRDAEVEAGLEPGGYARE